MRREVKYKKANIRLIYSLPSSPFILEIKGKGSHQYYFQVVVGFFMTKIRLYWTHLNTYKPRNTNKDPLHV